MIIQTFTSLIEAQRALQFLQQAGINCYLTDEIMGSTFTVGVGGVKLNVDEADASESQALLSAMK